MRPYVNGTPMGARDPSEASAVMTLGSFHPANGVEGQWRWGISCQEMC